MATNDTPEAYTILVDKATESLYSQLQEFKQNNTFCDITLLAEDYDETFPCHKVLLAASSPVFHAMFTSDYKEKNSQEVMLPNVEGPALKAIINSIYSGKLVLDIDNAAPILNVVHMFQMDGLKHHVADFILGHLDEDNCLYFWKTAEIIQDDHLKRCAWDFAVSHFDEVTQSPYFQELTLEEITDFINSPLLQVESEDKVCDRVLAWILNNKETYNLTNDQITDLILNLRFLEMTPEYITETLLDHTIVKGDNNLSVTLVGMSKAVNHQTPPPARAKILLPRLKSAVHKIACCGIDNSKVSQVAEIVLTEPNQASSKLNTTVYREKINCTKQSSEKLFEGISLCHVDNVLYLVGVHRYQVWKIKNDWERCADMRCNRIHHRAVGLDNAICLLGGIAFTDSYSLNTLPGNTVHYLDLSTNKWQCIGQILKAINRFAVAKVGDAIYMFGGNKNGSIYETCNQPSDVLQMFDLKTKQCTYLEVNTSPVSDVNDISYPEVKVMPSTEVKFSLSEIQAAIPYKAYVVLFSRRNVIICKIDPDNPKSLTPVKILQWANKPETFYSGFELLGNLVLCFGGSNYTRAISVAKMDEILWCEGNKFQWETIGSLPFAGPIYSSSYYIVKR